MSVWSRIRWHTAALPAIAFACFALTASAADEDFSSLTKRLQAEKPEFAQRQQALLAERYDLADRPANGSGMSRGKPVQEGVRVKLPKGMSWEKTRCNVAGRSQRKAALAGRISSVAASPP